MSLITGMSMNVNDNIVLIYYNTPYKKKGAMLCQQYIKSNHIFSKLCFDILGGLVFFLKLLLASVCVCVHAINIGKPLALWERGKEKNCF